MASMKKPDLSDLTLLLRGAVYAGAAIEGCLRIIVMQ